MNYDEIISSVLPRIQKLDGKKAPWSPQVGAAALADLASLPGRAYASLGRPQGEGYLEALGRTGPTLADPSSRIYQGEGDELAETVLRDPTLPLGMGLARLGAGLGMLGRAGVDAVGNAGLSAGSQYASEGRVDPLGTALAAGLGAAPHVMPRAPGARASIVDHPTLRKYGLNPDDGITLYHGSPREFDKFDLSKAGSQRAMTEGWGAYFTADKKNARAFGKNVIDLNLSADDLQRVIDLEAPMSAQTPFIRDALGSLSQAVPDPDDAMMRIQTMARDPMYKSYFRGEVGKSLWDYDKMRNLILSDEYINTPAGRILKDQFLPQDILGSSLVKRAEGSMSGSSRRGNNWLNDYGVIGYSMPSSRDILAKNKSTANAVIFDADVLSRFGTPSNSSTRAVTPTKALGSRLTSGAQAAFYRKYLAGDDRGDTPYTKARR